MKCLTGIVALLWLTAAQSQTPPAEVQTPTGQAADPSPVPQQAASPQQSAAPSLADPADVTTATAYLKEAWNDFTHCRRPSACNGYFESFGVALSFGDGSISPFAHVQRLGATSRDCIKTARTYLEQGDRSLAVQWAMASRVENKLVRDWLGSHPDAVLEALHHCCW